MWGGEGIAIGQLAKIIKLEFITFSPKINPFDHFEMEPPDGIKASCSLVGLASETRRYTMPTKKRRRGEFAMTSQV